MSNFKEQVAIDISNVFLNLQEFAEYHKIGGKKVVCVVDRNELQKREDKSGVNLGDFMIYVAEKDLDFVPQADADLLFDGKHCIITECKTSMGMYTLTLQQSRG